MNNINNLIAKMPKNELKRALEKERCARSFMEFIKLAWPVIEPANPFQNNWHIEAMSEHLECVTKGEIKRLLVNVPPGASKSTLCSVMFPAWEWTLAPHLRFLTLAHSENLAIRDTVKMRRLVQSDWYQDLWGDKVILRKDQNEKGHFENDATGFRQASPSKALTGKRGDRVICFPAHEVVHTEFGLMTIGDIVKGKKNIRVWSTDVETGKTELKPIIGWAHNPASEIIEVGLSDGSTFQCTPDHKIWTRSGWVEAGNLTPDKLIPVLFHGENLTVDRLPVYITNLGDVSETFCLTVEDYHTFYAGDGSVLVSNCDDIHSVDGANSTADREAVLQTFSESLPTRLNSPIESAIIVVMQRLHENDVSGYIIEKDLGYEHLMIPMRFERDRKCYTSIGWEDPRKVDGELMFPERFPEAVLQQLEKAMDNSYAIAGQFQQRPTPRGGGIIKREWWQLWDDETAAEFGATKGRYPKFDYVLASLDGAYTAKQENDPSALTIWGMFTDKAGNPKIMLVYAWAERLEFNALLSKVRHDCERFDVDCLVIESKATGITISQELRRTLSSGVMRVVLMNPGKGMVNVLGNDKIARAHAVTGMFEDGMIYAPDKVWAEAVILECEVFPKGKHDDRVDSVVQALQYFRNMGFALTREEIRDIDSADEAEEYGRMRGLIQGKLYDV